MVNESRGIEGGKVSVSEGKYRKLLETRVSRGVEVMAGEGK